jgi:hypothetical protein
MQRARPQRIRKLAPSVALAASFLVPASTAQAQFRHGGFSSPGRSTMSRPAPSYRPSGGVSTHRAPTYSRPSYHPSAGHYGPRPQVRPAPTYHPGTVAHGHGPQVRPAPGAYPGAITHSPGPQVRPFQVVRPGTVGYGTGIPTGVVQGYGPVTGFSSTNVGINSAQVGGYAYPSGGYVPTTGWSYSSGYVAPSTSSVDVSSLSSGSATVSTDVSSTTLDSSDASADSSSIALDGSSTTADSSSTTLDGSVTTPGDSSIAADGSSGTIAGQSAQRRFLGIDEQPVVEADGRRGMQVVRIYAGSAAERAGLQSGDVIHSANGYATQEFGNVTWVIDRTAAGQALQLSVRSARDGQEYLVTAQP